MKLCKGLYLFKIFGYEITVKNWTLYNLLVSEIFKGKIIGNYTQDFRTTGAAA